MAFLHTPHLQPSLHQLNTREGDRILAEYQQHMSPTEVSDAVVSIRMRGKAHLNLTHKTVAIRVESIVYALTILNRVG